jgi:hypothetical protein
MYTQEEVKELCNEMFKDLVVMEGDAEIQQDEDGYTVAIIPYYAHGRMNHHTINLDMMAKTALIFARSRTPSI